MVRLAVIVIVLAVLGGCDRRVAGGSADGAEVFAQACASCHGPEGIPPAAMEARLGVKDLTAAELHQRLSDADLRRQIALGSADHKMPAFGSVLSEEQLEALVAHLRSLRR
jgi:mono/diheme cytochrome c family protein